MNNLHNSDYELLTGHISYRYLKELSYIACTEDVEVLLHTLSHKYYKRASLDSTSTEDIRDYMCAAFSELYSGDTGLLLGKVVLLPEDASPEEKLILLLEARIRNPLGQLYAMYGKEAFVIPLEGICETISSANIKVPFVPFFKSWEHFSGSLAYPISTSMFSNAPLEYDVTPYRYFWDQDHPYGKLRVSLARHIITCLKERIRNNSPK